MWRDYTKLTRTELYEKVWSTPAHTLKEELGISDVMIGKICKKNGIPKPPPGYWARVGAGQQVRPTPLPKLKNGQREDIYIQRPPPDPLKPFRADAKRKAGEVEPVPVPERLNRPHPLVEATRSGLKNAQTNIYGLLEPPWKYEGLDVRVSPDQFPRTLRIMQALIRALEARGYKITVENEGQRRGTFALVDGQSIQFRLSESVQQVKRPLSAKPNPYSFLERRCDYFPRGHLKFVFGSTYSPKTRTDWQDTDKAPLEDKLHLVISGMIEQAELDRQAHLIWAEKQRQAQREREQREAIERRRREEAERRELLEAAAGRWAKSEELRAFLRACEAAWGPCEPDSHQRRWLDWAYQHADRFDPLKNGQVAEMLEKLPHADD
jgi:hypothetical protein